MKLTLASAALVLFGCAAKQMPSTCSEVAFGQLAAACVAKVRTAAPADRGSIAAACDDEITAKEDACYTEVSK